MKSLTTTMIAAAGFAVIGAFVAPAAASADPIDLVGPLVNSTCSFAQIDAALHATAPDVAADLDQYPDRKAQLENFFSLPIAQRQSMIQMFLANNPDAAAQGEAAANGPQSADIKQKAQKIADTCHNY